ncbi:hypothetical protein [Streptomyces sp. NPDC101393]|uniref:hypothetical protein n=1 Tax=Streptomyces sp. NPDC101393 TaxID=3366141 RepID=UPI00382277DD
MSAIEEAREANRQRHWAERQQRQQERGPQGIAEAWWDQVKQVCKAESRNGNPEAWEDLSRTLENFLLRYSA